MRLVCPTTGIVTLYHLLLRKYPPGFFTVRLLFPCVINELFGGKYLVLHKYPVFHQAFTH